jgi:hypothetical protein
MQKFPVNFFPAEIFHPPNPTAIPVFNANLVYQKQYWLSFSDAHPASLVTAAPIF